MSAPVNPNVRPILCLTLRALPSISELEAEVKAEYDAVEQYSQLADAARRQVDLLQRSKKAAEERCVLWLAFFRKSASRRATQCDAFARINACECVRGVLGACECLFSGGCGAGKCRPT